METKAKQNMKMTNSWESTMPGKKLKLIANTRMLYSKVHYNFAKLETNPLLMKLSVAKNKGNKSYKEIKISTHAKVKLLLYISHFGIVQILGDAFFTKACPHIQKSAYLRHHKSMFKYI